MAETGRNGPCPCGSGRKYKACCLAKDEAAAREARAAAATKAEAEAQEAAGKSEGAEAARPGPAQPRHGTAQPWKRGAQDTRGHGRFAGPRRAGGS